MQARPNDEPGDVVMSAEPVFMAEDVAVHAVTLALFTQRDRSSSRRS